MQQINIKEVTLFTGCSADQITVTFDLPNWEWPYDGNQYCKMQVATAKGTGKEYIEKYFPTIIPKVIEI